MVHGTRYGYAKLGCRCDSCREATLAYQRAYREKNRERRNQYQRAKYAEANKHKSPKLTKPLVEILQAGRLLEDGASYAEVARTVGWDSHTVARLFPNRGWTRQQVAEYGKLMLKHRDVL